MKINPENWTFCQFRSQELAAFVSLGAQPDDSSGPELLYFVTVTHNNEKEIFQKSYVTLNKALDAINSKYSHWSFFDALNQSGCSTCY